MKYLILFLVFSFFGVGVEVFFSSIHDYIRYRDTSLKGRSYLWMFPLYGIWGIVIGPLYYILRGIPFFARGFIYLVIIFIGELGYGYFLKATIKKCPWEYRGKWTIGGVVNIIYLPFWLIFGYISELLYRGFIEITMFDI
jgi:hypothetical protein